MSKCTSRALCCGCQRARLGLVAAVLPDMVAYAAGRARVVCEHHFLAISAGRGAGTAWQCGSWLLPTLAADTLCRPRRTLLQPPPYSTVAKNARCMPQRTVVERVHSADVLCATGAGTSLRVT
jgi:hypothetical protein